ncbi:MAG: HD domain-containing phosphohydrolase [Suilimivivens sp.]
MNMRRGIAGIGAGLLFLVAVMICSKSFTVTAAENDDSAGDYVVTVYNEKNGLPTGEANVVMQTSDGYIWIGSYGGLIRYDGTNFVNYSEKEAGLISSSVRSLFEDSRGRMLIGTNDAGVFVYDNNEFTKIEGPEDHSFLCIRDFAEDENGVIYAASSSGLAEIKENTLVPVDDEKIAGNTVYSIGIDNYGRVWCSLSQGICDIVEQGKVVAQLPSDYFFEDTEIYCIASGNVGDIYLGTAGNQIARVLCRDEGFEKDSFEVTHFDTEEVTTHNQIRVCEDGRILVSGLRGFGCITAADSFYQFGENQHATSINAATFDYEGNLWLASTSLGIVKYSKGCFESPNEKAGLNGTALNTVVKLDKEYYVGTDEGLLAFDKDWNAVENPLTRALSGNRIRHMIVTEDGLLWIASYYGSGLVSYDPGTEEIVFYGSEEGLVNEGVRVLLELSDGSIAAGTQSGISIIKDGRIVKNYTKEDKNGLKNGTILCLAEGPDGVLLAGSDGGGIYAILGDEIQNYGFEQGLSEGVVLRLLQDTEGTGWFVSAGSSLYYFEDGSFRKLSNFKKSAGSIFDFYIMDGKLWMMQNNGILAADREELVLGNDVETILYGASYGLTGSLNANTWNYLDEEGTLYLVTRSGISLFRFAPAHNPLPRGIINEIQVDQKIYQNPKELTVNEDATRITIDFSTLSYTGTTVSKMSYQLLGFDQRETVIADEKNSSISYTNLPGGNYTFCLKIFDPADPKTSYEYRVPIYKEKKITEFPLFWILVLTILMLMFAGISYFIARAKISRIKKRQKEYQDIVEQFMMAFAKLIDAKDPYTNGHSIRVAWYSREIAKRLQMSQEEQERIYYIALMHDIGKVGIPDSILKKEGKLTDEEMDVIRTHPAIGGRILKDCTALKGIAEGAQYHHERFDGTGYCMGLKGEEIPLIARIIGVADAYDAMSNARCYRKALDKEVIIGELTRGAGTQFDPDIVPIMLQMIEEGSVPVDLEGKRITEKVSE